MQSTPKRTGDFGEPSKFQNLAVSSTDFRGLSKRGIRHAIAFYANLTDGCLRGIAADRCRATNFHFGRLLPKREGRPPLANAVALRRVR